MASLFNIDEKILWGAMLGFASVIVSRWFVLKLEKRIKEKSELKLLICEIQDIVRHCRANVEILENINLNIGVPAEMHFQKMKIMESHLLFSVESFRAIHSKHSSLLTRLKYTVRNLNLEIDDTTSQAKIIPYDEYTMKQYHNYLKIKHLYVIERLTFEVHTFSRKARNYNGLDRPKHIVYKNRAGV